MHNKVIEYGILSAKLTIFDTLWTWKRQTVFWNVFKDMTMLKIESKCVMYFVAHKISRLNFRG